MDGQVTLLDLLQRGAKRQHTPGSKEKHQLLNKRIKATRNTKVKSDRSSFSTCPVCSASIPRALVISHVNQCLDDRTQSDAQPQACQTPRQSNSAEGGDEPAVPKGLHLGEPVAGAACVVHISRGSSQALHPESDRLGLDFKPQQHNSPDLTPEISQPCVAKPVQQQPSLEGSLASTQSCQHRLGAACGTSLGDEVQQVCSQGIAPAHNEPLSVADCAGASALGTPGAPLLTNGPWAVAAEPGTSTQPAACDHQPAEREHFHQEAATRTAPAPVTAAAAAPPARPNALSRLMQRQRERRQHATFFLELEPDGNWRWHWWAKPTASPTSPASENPTCGSKQSAGSSEALAQCQEGLINEDGRQPGSQSPPAGDQAAEVCLHPDEAGRQPANGDSSSGLCAPDGQHGSVAASDCGLSGRANASQSREGTVPTREGGGAGSSEDGGRIAGPAPWRQLQAVWSATTELAANKLGMGGGKGDKVVIKLASNVGPGHGGRVAWDSGDLASNAPQLEGSYHGGASLVKSALQKNVRLCCPESAVRCALHLLKMDAAEFLRRCCIICLEDAVLHPGLPLLTWLMAAQAKGFQLGVSQATACLKIVHQLASVPVRDPQTSCTDDPFADLAAAAQAPTNRPFGLQQLSVVESLLVRCMRIRAAYGGMSGDVDMLDGYAGLWAARFAGTAPGPPSLVLAPGQVALASAMVQGGGACRSGSQPGEAGSDEGQGLGDAAACGDEPRRGNEARFGSGHASGWLEFLHTTYDAQQLGTAGSEVCVQKVGPMRRVDIPLSAIDFHVSNILEDLLQQAPLNSAAQAAAAVAGGSPQQALQQAMWLFRSSINRKAPVTWAGKIENWPVDSQTDNGKLALASLWQVAAAPAELWAEKFLRKRFF